MSRSQKRKWEIHSSVSSEISKEILKLIEKRNMDRSSHKNSYYEELKAQAELKQAQRKLEKEAER